MLFSRPTCLLDFLRVKSHAQNYKGIMERIGEGGKQKEVNEMGIRRGFLRLFT